MGINLIYPSFTLKKSGIVDIIDQIVSAGATYNIISLSELGYVDECLISSPSTDFSVIVNIDGNEILNRTYTEYTNITQVIGGIAAFEERDSDGNPTGKYIVHLKDINFKNSITIQVKNDSGGSITFHNLFCKYKTM